MLGLGLMIDDNILKYNSQCPKLIHVLAMLINLLRHILSLMIALRCFHDNLFSPGVNELLHLAIKLLNSLAKNEFQIVVYLVRISSNKSELICQF